MSTDSVITLWHKFKRLRQIDGKKTRPRSSCTGYKPHLNSSIKACSPLWHKQTNKQTKNENINIDLSCWAPVPLEGASSPLWEPLLLNMFDSSWRKNFLVTCESVLHSHLSQLLWVYTFTAGINLIQLMWCGQWKHCSKFLSICLTNQGSVYSPHY